MAGLAGRAAFRLLSLLAALLSAQLFLAALHLHFSLSRFFGNLLCIHFNYIHILKHSFQ